MRLAKVPVVRWILCIGAVGIASLLAVGAPIMPGATKLPGHVRSLAKIDRIRLVIDPIPPHLADAGITRSSIRERAAGLLENYEIALDDKSEDLPELHLVLIEITETDVADAIAYLLGVQLHQTVRIPRLNESVRVPTYSHIGGGLEARSKVEDSVRTVVDTMIKIFGNNARQATQAFERR